MKSKKLSVAIIGGVVLAMSPVKTFAEEEVWEADEGIEDDDLDDDADMDEDTDPVEDETEDAEIVQQLARISFAKKNYVMKKKGKVKLKINANRYSGGVKSIQSSNRKVATVNAKGIVVGKKDGVAIITATSKKGNITTQTAVVVGKAVKFSEDRLLMTPKKKTRLKLIGNGKKKVKSWKSSNKKVVKVDAKGNIKTLKSGSATVTAILKGGLKATCKVKVVDQTQQLILNTNQVVMSDRDDDYKIEVKRSPADSVGDITFSSTNPDVAIVDESGAITSVDAGSCEILVKCNGIVQSVKVTVYESDQSDDDDDDDND